MTNVQHGLFNINEYLLSPWKVPGAILSLRETRQTSLLGCSLHFFVGEITQCREFQEHRQGKGLAGITWFVSERGC